MERRDLRQQGGFPLVLNVVLLLYLLNKKFPCSYQLWLNVNFYRVQAINLQKLMKL